MFGGANQGGGGSNLVRLTSLFPSKKGNGVYVGSIKPEAFNTVFKVMQDAHAKGVDLMFILSPDKRNPNNGVLSIGASNRQSNSGGGFGGQQTPFGPQVTAPAPTQYTQPPAQFATPVPQSQNAAMTAAPFGAQAGVSNPTNPPKDEIDDLLESLN